MILGLGVDLCEIARMERAIAREGFLARYFTQEERDYIASRGAMGAQTAAGLFAAKEAMLKALGVGLAVPLREAGVTHDAQGAPRAALTGAAAARLAALGGQTMHLSISHEGGMAVAMAVAEG